jgi:hypothetical protein
MIAGDTSPQASATLLEAEYSRYESLIGRVGMRQQQ